VTEQAVDFSFDHQNPEHLAVAFVAAGRYLAYRFGATAPKVITLDEAIALWKAGLSIFFVWQVGTDWTTWNGAEADRQLAELGIPLHIPIYWAVDRDIAAGDYFLVGQMLDGVNSVRPRGIYLEASGVQWLMDRGRAQYGWISSAYGWSIGGRPYTSEHAKAQAPSANLCQLVGAPFPGIDVNDIMKDDYGQWHPDMAKPQPEEKPTESEDEEMPLMWIIKGNRSDEWWFTDLFTDKHHIMSVDDAAAIIWSYAVNGYKLAHADNNQPIVFDQAFVDQIGA
jgi:hypothetical protein